MAVFIGTFENKVDKKGRVSVPAVFRQALGSEGFQGIIVFPSHRAPAVEACSMEFMEDLNGRVAGFDLFSETHDDLTFTIFSDSQPLGFDSEGRVGIPPQMLKGAGITDRAAFVGKGQTFQIWEPEALYQKKEEARERARSQGLTLPGIGNQGGSA